MDKTLGHYQIVRMLGSGGMGQVFEAIHDQMKRRAAIKILHKRFAHNRQIATRFLNEAKATSMVEHPGIVHIYEFGQTDDGTAFIVMEYLSGETLRHRLDELGGKLPKEDATRLARQMASALSAAHAKGIVHRDLKPVNVMIVRDGESVGGERAKILDFGLAKIIEPEGGEGITNTGTILGTPAYMAPEQCKSARAADPKSDVYSLGVILYEMLTGDIPFDADTDAELLSKHMFSEPPPLLASAPHAGTELAALVHKMLGKDTDTRPSAAEVAAELQQLQSAQGTIATSGPVPSAASDRSSRRNLVTDTSEPTPEDSSKRKVPTEAREAVPIGDSTATPTHPTTFPVLRRRKSRKLFWFLLLLFLSALGTTVLWQWKGEAWFHDLLGL